MRAGTSNADRLTTPQGGNSALMVGGLAAILASTCCPGPLILITAGLSGAWIGNLTALERCRLVFIGVAALIRATRDAGYPSTLVKSAR
jgi:mercuric ion transport protein